MPRANRKAKERLDLSNVYRDPEIRIDDWLAKVYDLEAAVMFSVTKSGAISMTVFAGTQREKFYIETPFEAKDMFTEAMDALLQYS